VSWVGGQKVGIFHISQHLLARQAPGEWAQAYHCGSRAADLALRGAGADNPIVRAAV